MITNRLAFGLVFGWALGWALGLTFGLPFGFPLSLAAQAQESAAIPVILPNQSSVFNQSTVNLPTPPAVNGQDIIRGSSGVSCQTAVSNGGAYVDIGVIGSQDVFSRDTAAVYGRVVFPLGKRPDRPDCTKLYALEIQRLQMELQLLSFNAGGINGAAGAISPPQPAQVAPTRPEPIATRPPIETGVEPGTSNGLAYRQPDAQPLIIPPLDRHGDERAHHARTKEDSKRTHVSAPLETGAPADDDDRADDAASPDGPI